MRIANKAWSAPFIVWVAIGTVVPILSIIYYGLTSSEGGFTMENLKQAFEYYNMKALLMSLELAFTSTLVCLILAFPLAMILSNSRFGRKGLVVFVFILPMWMNFLLRTMAWQVLLEKKGVINSILASLGLPAQHLMNTPAAIVFGMVYDFLPFMVIPLYNVISKLDKSLIDAAYDLGASKRQVFSKIVLPLSLPGIISGVTMVFIPALTTFVISNMLGGGKINLIGNVIEQEFTVNSNWYLGSGLSLIMMVFIIISMVLLNKFDKTGGASLI